ncbi:MAG: flagellar hook-associated protein FlgL [Methylococcaceae bacterium]
MRISTNSFFEASSSRLTELQSKISATSDQISSGRRMLNPSDDPVAAAQIIGVQQSQSINTQFSKNITSIQNNLGVVDTTLADIVNNLQGIHDQVISAGNGTLADGDKAAIALNLQGFYDQLLSLSNSTDTSGNYIFGGQKTDTAPFVKNAAQVNIATVNGQLGAYQVSAGGSFTVPASNATWLDATGAPLAAGSVLLAGETFYSAGTGVPATYANAPAGAAILETEAIEYKGGTTQSKIQVNNSRQMAASVLGSDMFSNGDVFNKLQAAITALKMPNSTNPISLQISAVSDLSSSFTTTFAAVSIAQSSVGTRLTSLDGLIAANGNLGLQLTKTLSGLQDTDYNQAVSDLTRQQFILQAAQKTFAQIGKSSLFDFIA